MLTKPTIKHAKRSKADVTVQSNPDQYGRIRITTSIPPSKPEIRLNFTPFEKTKRQDKEFTKNSYTHSYILTTKESVELLVASFRKAAELLETTTDDLPSRNDLA